MTEEPEEEKIVTPEVVEGVPPEAEPAIQRGKTFFHPLSGLTILGIDWLAFGGEFFSGFVMLALAGAAAFIAAFFAVSAIQRRLHGDSPAKAALKALIGAAAAGVPFPVAGTVIGGAIFLLSGLPSLRELRRKG